jgi:hypothetical protein
LLTSACCFLKLKQITATHFRAFHQLRETAEICDGDFCC